MRISTYQKKMESALKHRPHFESANVSATVVLTGLESTPVIDMGIGDQVYSVNIDEAKQLATWIKQVAR